MTALTPEDRARLDEIRARHADREEVLKEGWLREVSPVPIHFDRGFLLDLIDRLSTPVSPPGLHPIPCDICREPYDLEHDLRLELDDLIGDVAETLGWKDGEAREWLRGWLTRAGTGSPVSPPDGDLLGLCEEVLRLDGEGTPEPAAPPARASGTIEVDLRYRGRSKPIPIEDPREDLWVEARRLCRAAFDMVPAEHKPVYWPLLEAGRALHPTLGDTHGNKRDPAAAERHLLAAREAAERVDLRWARASLRVPISASTPLDVAITAALTVVRALPRGQA